MIVHLSLHLYGRGPYEFRNDSVVRYPGTRRWRVISAAR